MGEVFEHREELGTLKEQGEEEKKKAEALAEERLTFQNILSALREKRLEKGMPAKEVAQKFGRPWVESQKVSALEWLYFNPSGKWLQNPRIQLNFDKDKRLAGWECFYVECAANRDFTSGN